MPTQHSKATIISMAIIATAIATLLHEGVGHGVMAWFRGDIVTELTSNHLIRYFVESVLMSVVTGDFRC
jgi:hypothetical protein